jgi:hypothetical protein
MKESDGNELRRLKDENAQLQARLKRAHKNYDELLAGHLMALRALPQGPAAHALSVETTLQRLIRLLESYGRVLPVTPATKVGPASNDLDTLRADINETWDFPAGKKFNPGDISNDEATQTLARDIDNRGGVLHGN